MKMSENKSGISPFRNEEYLKSSSSRNNRSAEFRNKVTEKDKNEFNEVFSDEELDSGIHDGTGLFSSFRVNAPQQKAAPKAQKPSAPAIKKSAPAPVKAPAPAASYSSDDLYAVPDVNIDALISSLASGTAPSGHISEKKPVSVKADSDEQTKMFNSSPTPKKQQMSERTRSFSLNSKAKSKIKATIPKPHKQADIKGGVRVLSENKMDDEAILETMPSGDDAVNPLDVVSAKKGEDIFSAVDKAVKKSKNLSSQGFSQNSVASARQKAKKKKQEDAVLTGKNLAASLAKSCNTMMIQLVFCVALFFLTSILTILPAFYTEGNILEFMFGGGGTVYSVINIVLLVVMILVFIRNYISAVKGIISLKPNSDTVLLIVTLFVLLHDVATAIMNTAGLNGVRMYTLVAVFAAAFKCLGDYFTTRTKLHGVNVVLKGKNLQSVHPVKNKADADSLAQGITDKGNPNILYCAKIDACDSMPEVNPENSASQKYYTFLSIAVLVLSFVLSVFVYIRSKNGGEYMTSLLSSICLCLPVLSDTLRSINIYFENMSLRKSGAAATSYEGIRLVGKANGVVMDISDIFTAEVSSFRLTPDAYISKNDAALYASSVTMAADTLTGKCFGDFAKQTESDVPEAENIQYEDLLGYSAWVNGKRVLVGNRKMLIQHSIPAPDENEEKKYAKNKFLMYLVVDGQLSATFLVNYKVISSIKKLSGSFNKTGLVLMLTSKEPCLPQIEIANRLGIDAAAVKLLSGKGSSIINEYRGNKMSKTTGGLVCTKKSKALLPLVLSAHNLFNSDKLLFNIGILGQAAAFLLIVLSHLLNMPIFHSPFTIVFLQLVWSVAIWFLCTKKVVK